ncbi:g11054 [Coccomyxa elongata]
MVASEKAIKEANWAGQIPLKLVLASNEITSLDTPSPLYALAFRLGYLPTVAAQALEFFQEVLPPGSNTPWFEYKRIPLPWQIPVGVLYDLLASENEQPWHLTVHFRSFPSDTLLRWDGDITLRAAFFNSLKEAAYICQGSARSVMDMALQAQNDLWSAVTAGDAEQYASISSSLNMSPKARGERRPSVPLRLYVRHTHGGYMASLNSATQYTSRPVETVTESGRSRTLQEVLLALLSDLGGGAASAEPESSNTSTSQPISTLEKDADAEGEATGDVHRAASSAIDETWQSLSSVHS